jgi:hypothetical protein
LVWYNLLDAEIKVTDFLTVLTLEQAIKTKQYGALTLLTNIFEMKE